MTILENLGLSDPSATFALFKKLGDEDLMEMRAKVAKPNEVKQERTWTITEAASLIGRSIPWLRDNDPECPTNEKGKRQYTLTRINAIRDAIGTRYVRPEGSKATIMAVSNFKGGVAKTTTVVHLAQKAAIEGLRVLVVDLDTQATATFSLGNIIPDVELKPEDTPVNAMLNDPESFKYIIRSTYFSSVSLAPANLSLHDLDLSLPRSELNNEDRIGSPAFRLSQCLESIREDFDLILLDCPPNMGSITTNALIACDALLIPVPPKEFDRASFVMFSDALSGLFGASGQQLNYHRILLTLHEDTKASCDQEKKIRRRYEPYVLSHNMYKSTEVEKATARQSSIYDLEKPISNRATYDRAHNYFNAVNEEIINDLKTIWEAQANER